MRNYRGKQNNHILFNGIIDLQWPMPQLQKTACLNLVRLGIFAFLAKRFNVARCTVISKKASLENAVHMTRSAPLLVAWTIMDEVFTTRNSR